MSQQKPDHGFWVSWATNVLVGLIVFLALCLAHDLPPLQHLERIGGDFAMRAYVHDDRVLDVPRIVILAIDEPTKVAWAESGGTIGSRLVDLIRLVRHDGPKHPRNVRTVILDVQIQDTVAEDIQKALVKELKQNGPRVVLPLQELRPTQGEAAWEGLSDRFDREGVSEQPYIVRGLSLLSPDEDDRVVRHLTTDMCILRHLPAKAAGRGEEVIAWRWVPTLAEAAVNNHDDEKCEPGQRGEEQLILFRTGAVGFPEANQFTTLSAHVMIDKDGKVIASDSNLALLTDAYVLIGQTYTATWTDQHLTPIGPMPGVLVHANALSTLLKGTQQHNSTFWYEFTAIIVIGCLFAAMSTAVNAFIGWLKWGEFRAATLRILALAIVGFVAALSLRTLWGLVAASALREGNVIGTFVPVLAVGLEAALEAGNLLITGIHKLIKAINKAVAAYLPLTITILILTAASALAQDKVGTLTVTQERAEVEIIRKNQSIKPIGLSLDLYPFDVVIVHSRNDVVIDRYGHPPLVLHGPASFLVSPPTRGGVASFWDNFWQQPVVQPVVQPGITSVPGITPVPRSSHDGTTPDIIAILTSGGDIGRSLPIQGAMRALSAFTDARFLKTGGSGLALAWAGGTPPYEVVVETEDGVALAQFASPAPFLWQPDWQMPNAVVRLRIYDGNDRVVRAELRPSTDVPALENNDPVAGPVELFQKQPVWRYEAFRMLASEAAHNPQAAQAVLAIRLSE